MGGLLEEKANAAANGSAPHPEVGIDETPAYLEISIPKESLTGFEADFEKVSAKWPSDLKTTTDDAKIEQFVASAHALARRWLSEELVARLERFMWDPSEPPALVIRGLPIDKDLPLTEPDCHLKKYLGTCISETWLIGIGRILGQVFNYKYLRGTKSGMGALVRDLYPTRDNVLGTRGLKDFRLDIHMDYFQVKPEQFPHIILFMGLKTDPNGEGNTLLVHNQKLCKALDPADLKLLRCEKLTWKLQMTGMHFSGHVIQGDESNPQINLFEENLPNMGGTDTMLKDSNPEAVAAYKRVKEIAATLSEGVILEGGDVLLLNQRKAVHGREPISPKYDGNDRWLERIYVNSGNFWPAGLAQYPCRAITDPSFDK